VLTVPLQLSTDHLSLLSLARSRGGCFTRADVIEALGWSEHRVVVAVTEVLRQGVCMVDDQHESGSRAYWMG
jgi:hypothetical protein